MVYRTLTGYTLAELLSRSALIPGIEVHAADLEYALAVSSRLTTEPGRASKNQYIAKSISRMVNVLAYIFPLTRSLCATLRPNYHGSDNITENALTIKVLSYIPPNYVANELFHDARSAQSVRMQVSRFAWLLKDLLTNNLSPPSHM